MVAQSSTIDKDEIERFNRIAEEWWDAHGKFRPLHVMNPVRIRYIRDKVCAHFDRSAEELRPFAGLRLLDIGCGGGLICEPMARMGAHVTGIDAGDKNIAVASLHAQNMGLAIDYRKGSAESLAVDGGQYDVVLALEIVEHVADVPTFLSTCAQLVKPGGLLFMSTLNRTIKSFGMAIIGAEYVLRWLPRGTHQWKKFLKPSDLCIPLTQAGLNVQHLTGMVYNPFNGSWRLSEKDLDVNYILIAAKASSAEIQGPV